MLLGQKLGLDPAILAAVINSSTGGCWASSVNNPVPGALPDKSPPCVRDYQGGFVTALMLKVCMVWTLLMSPTVRFPSSNSNVLLGFLGYGAGDRDCQEEQ